MDIYIYYKVNIKYIATTLKNFQYLYSRKNVRDSKTFITAINYVHICPLEILLFHL